MNGSNYRALREFTGTFLLCLYEFGDTMRAAYQALVSLINSNRRFHSIIGGVITAARLFYWHRTTRGIASKQSRPKPPPVTMESKSSMASFLA
jgi:hypothetical protein